MKISLSESEYQELKSIYKKEKDKSKADRINIILLLHKGYSCLEISGILNLDRDTILFMDSVHPTHHTTPGKVWSEKGVCRWVQSNTGRQRLNISGAYNPINQKVVTIMEDTLNSDAAIKLLEKCIQEYSHMHHITVYLDNAAYHKSKEVKAFLDTHDKISLSFLPPYSPNLNLIERLWKFADEKVNNLRYYPDFSRFKEKILKFYENIGQYAHELEKRITFNFRTFKNVIS